MNIMNDRFETSISMNERIFAWLGEFPLSKWRRGRQENIFNDDNGNEIHVFREGIKILDKKSNGLVYRFLPKTRLELFHLIEPSKFTILG